jgi:hypothetical protein
MPRTPTDYSKTIIYKIVCNDFLIKDVYVGSTTSFKDRKYLHKNDCNNKKSKRNNQKIYVIIRANGGWDNFSMIEIEKYPCCDNYEARARERYWYELINANMNSQRPQITVDERIYYLKKYRELNKSLINEKQNQKSKCLCGSCYTNKNKQQHFRSNKHIKYLEENNEKII